jgi:hypothetical protein
MKEVAMIPLLRILALTLAIWLFTPAAVLYGQWVQQPFPTSEVLWKVRFIDESTGWVLGQEFVYKTTDGGTTWIPQDSSLGSGSALHARNADVVFHANFTGIDPYTDGIRRSTDGGTSWATVDTMKFFYTDFEFVDALNGFAVGGTTLYEPVVRRTSDGGNTWTTVWTGSSGFELQGISFADAMRGWTVSYQGYVYNTTDGGSTWMLQDSIRPPGPPGPYTPTRDI